jgi:hypothetical protein
MMTSGASYMNGRKKFSAPKVVRTNEDTGFELEKANTCEVGSRPESFIFV